MDRLDFMRTHRNSIKIVIVMVLIRFLRLTK